MRIIPCRMHFTKAPLWRKGCLFRWSIIAGVRPLSILQRSDPVSLFFSYFWALGSVFYNVAELFHFFSRLICLLPLLLFSEFLSLSYKFQGLQRILPCFFLENIKLKNESISLKIPAPLCFFGAYLVFEILTFVSPINLKARKRQSAC